MFYIIYKITHKYICYYMILSKQRTFRLDKYLYRIRDEAVQC